MAHLEIKQLSKRFGSFTALDRIDLSVAQGEFVVLLGPSGCGKTTLLRTIAGLERQDSGEIMHAGHDISHASPAQRDYGIVFQSYALFPNLSVADNIAYGLNSRRKIGVAGAVGALQRVADMLDLVGLPGCEQKYPTQLSGGQQQRVALARALATSPHLLLLDEPLSALDAIERVRLRSEIRQLQSRLGITTLMVTHDQEEALSMADRIVVMNSGRIQQIGTPQEIYRAPCNDFVADFIGRGNLLEATSQAQGNFLFGKVRLRCASAAVDVAAPRFYVRPEDIGLHAITDTPENSFTATVSKSEFMGSSYLVTLDTDMDQRKPLVAQFSSNYLEGSSIHPGALLRVSIPAERLRPMTSST
ncbi:putative 2-aminoethylphosphonate ABC transporter ATP-binding protein [Actimicrobium antarcticum]|uniref:2-aminoethylphosphonate ABC transporter ATP-binding protein n=1 Tax=Actimicrobium antarcticum TaxID=1051899 RepID=A0ABP7TV61_9BURK